MARPSMRYVYHPARDQIYEVYFRRDVARVVSRVGKARGQRGNPKQLWDGLSGDPSALVRDIIALCDANTSGDSYADASAAMDAAFRREREARGWKDPAPPDPP